MPPRVLATIRKLRENHAYATNSDAGSLDNAKYPICHLIHVQRLGQCSVSHLAQMPTIREPPSMNRTECQNLRE